MNSLKAFLKEKGLYLVCLALIFAATVTSIWAIRSVVTNLADYTKTKQEAQKEDSTWDAPQAEVNKPVTDVPEPTSAPSAASSASGASSGARSASSAALSGSAGSAALSTRSAGSAAPVAGKITVPYSGDALVLNQTLNDWRTHNGTDYACDTGAAVQACAAGTVEAAYEDALWGGVVEVKDSEGLTWKYCGLADPVLKQGDTLAAGDAVGTVAAIPAEANDGPHLHLECLSGGAWVDPETLIDK